ncbi:helix-turn-helix domain-containing protein [Streptomyces sp. NEAU-H3]|uniref:helix-turn-helix domain-containing protein n=1 Tax=Streptomyces sp. NEAU-H3 TaxID=2720636 RepID=UPI001438DDB2|nr:helix-turn-helix domain-containing protein [Streptomyces sp. NEAU-H3]NJA56669.1 helix-turn-helix domain-containing protein [Streptomyces sp. NEAU-H3]
MPADSSAELLDAIQVAAILKLHPQTVRRLVREKRITAHRLGTGAVRRRGLRIPRAAVDNFLSDSAAA